MLLIEKRGDLFKTDTQYFVQCISADFGMGAGIAVEFNKRFDTKKRLYNIFNGDITYGWDTHTPHGTCIIADNVFNLVTKRNYWDKPSYEDLESALRVMKYLMLENNIQSISMPKIGCGLDKLDWQKVKLMLINIFEDTNCIINVYYL